MRAPAIRSAAALLGVEEDCLLLADGEIKTPDGRAVSLARLATLWKGVPGYALPGRDDPGLDETAHFHCDAQSYAGASHACEVEVDPGTGAAHLLRYVAVHDSGRIINPVLAGGQVHGGVAHGIGNALFEWMGYDAERSPSPRPSPSTCCRRRRSRPASTCCSSRRPPRSIPWASRA